MFALQCVCMLQIKDCWMDFVEIWYVNCVVEAQCKFALFESVRSIVTTRRM
jgi:hypothetical protein